MLSIQSYNFLIGRKIPFSEWPEIVQRFLEQQSLHYGQFLYYFEDFNRDALSKAVKDCPKMGPIRTRPSKAGEIFYLSNLEDGRGCTEAEIMALMPKIYRRYGFNNSYILYQDVNFFSRDMPVIIQPPGNEPFCVKGPSIRLYRDTLTPRWSGIELQIVIDNGAETFDPTSYYDAMKRLLPGVRCMGTVECCMTEAEQRTYDALNQSAAQLLKNAYDYLDKLLPNYSLRPSYREEIPKIAVAPVLKKMCKQYGYTYIKYEYDVFFIQKRTKNGHYILLDIYVGPVFRAVDVGIQYIGVGFKHGIASFHHTPLDQADLEAFLSECFCAFSSAEKEVFPALDAHFPPTPKWFSPVI